MIKGVSLMVDIYFFILFKKKNTNKYLDFLKWVQEPKMDTG